MESALIPRSVAVLFAAALSGCIVGDGTTADPLLPEAAEPESGEPDDQPGAEPDPPPRNPPGGDVGGALPAPAAALWLEGCTGWQLAVRSTTRDAWQAPPGWEAQDGRLWVTVEFFSYLCDRIAFGSVERGPVRLIIAMHDAQQAPMACREGADGMDLRTLHKVWVDSDEVAGALAGWARLPVEAAAIDIVAADPGSLSSWSWRGQDGGRSAVAWPEHQPDRQAAAMRDRVFHHHDNGLVVLDLRTDFLEGEVPDRIAQASWPEEHPLAEDPLGHAAPIRQMADVSVQAMVSMQEGGACDA